MIASERNPDDAWEIDDGNWNAEPCLDGDSWIARWRRLTAAGLPLWYARELLAETEEQAAAEAKQKKRGPNDQIVMAAIGVGGQGTGIMKWAKRQARRQVRRRLRRRRRPRKKAAKEVGKDCHEYKDFRELLAKEELDAVTDRHGRPLARPDLDRGDEGRLRRLLREAALPDHRGRQGDGQGGPEV